MGTKPPTKVHTDNSFKRDKPDYDEILNTVMLHLDRICILMTELGMNRKLMEDFNFILQTEKKHFYSESVISHGDLHRGNIAVLIENDFKKDFWLIEEL